MICRATGVLPDILPVSLALPTATGLPALRASVVQPDSSGLPGGSATGLARRATHSRRSGECGFSSLQIIDLDHKESVGRVYFEMKNV